MFGVLLVVIRASMQPVTRSHFHRCNCHVVDPRRCTEISAIAYDNEHHRSARPCIQALQA